MKRVAIIGGGISGLSAAFYLEKARAAGADLEYTLFESGQRLGGSMYSDRVEGCLVEAGPDSFLTEKPWALSLCKDLDIADQLIGSNDAQRKTYIVVNGRLVVMPDGLMFMVPTQLVPTALSPLFSWSTKLRMARELLHPPRPMQTDETVAELVERHFGAEVVDRLADPLLSGVYGGDAAKLSARAVLPRFVEMEEKYGSLSRAMLAAHKKMMAARKGAGAPAVYLLAGWHAADGGRHCRPLGPRIHPLAHAHPPRLSRGFVFVVARGGRDERRGTLRCRAHSYSRQCCGDTAGRRGPRPRAEPPGHYLQLVRHGHPRLLH